MTPDIRLVAIDLDGTLLDPAKNLDPDYPAVLAELLERGVAVVPASGRQHESIRRLLQVPALKERYGPGGIIAENGALATWQGEVVSTDPVQPRVVHAVLDAVASYRASGGQVGVVICGRRSAYTDLSADQARTEISPYYPFLETDADLSSAAEQDDVLKLAVWEVAGTERGVARSLLATQETGARVLLSGVHWVDVMSPTADKGRALASLQARLGISPEQTMAFGDYPNDVGMLRRAQYSYAMAEAHPEAVAVSRYRAPSNAAQGVTRTLREVFNLG